MKITIVPISADRKMNPYRHRETGNLVYVYDINATPEEIVAYKAANPKAITDSKSGKTLFFTTKFVGKEAELQKSEKGVWFVDTIKDEQFASFCKIGGLEYAKMKMAELG